MNKLRYPKLFLLACSFVLAYALYMQGVFDMLPELLNGHGYISMFLGGLLFSFGFTTPFAIAIFAAMSGLVNPLLGALIGAVGAMVADMFIFQFIRVSFMDELRQLKTSALFRWFRDRRHRESVPERMRQYVQWSVAGILIASPLPDELGVSLLSGLTEIKSKPFAIACYFMNATGILIMLLVSQAL
jgi:hypothetical protein